MQPLTLRVERGLVVDSWPTVGSCVVSITGRRRVVASMQFGGSPTGVGGCSYVEPGDRVLVAIDDAEQATVVGVSPREVLDMAADAVVHIGRPFSGLDIKADPSQTPSTARLEETGISHFAPSMPKDALPGDWIASSPAGPTVWVGRLVTGMRASRLASITASAVGHHLRVIGSQFEQWTGSTDERLLNDDGECHSVTMEALYPWELLGAASADDVAITEGSDGVWSAEQTSETLIAADDNLAPFGRLITFGGYLGDIRRELVVLPPESGLNLIGEPLELTGLSEFVRLSDGHVGISSRKRVKLSRTNYIAAPVQLRQPTDSAGDNARSGNYKFSGIYGEAVDHQKAESATPEETSPAASGLLTEDRDAYNGHAYALQSIIRHGGDWRVRSEADAGVTRDTDLFAPMEKQATQPLPASESVKIDHREGHSTRLFKGKASITLEDDGSVTIEDAWGSQVVMSGGNIDISCQGDVNLRPGRSLNVIAGGDANVRARNCVDISSGTADIRVKAERNLHMLAGNSGEGGVLVESRGEGGATEYDFEGVGTDVVTSGITLLSKDARIQQYGSGVYIRSVDNDPVIIDANGGEADVEVYASYLHRNLYNAKTAVYGTRASRGETPIATEFQSAYEAYFGQQTRFSVAPQMLLAGDMLANGQVVGVQGLIGEELGNPTAQTRQSVGAAVASLEENPSVPVSERNIRPQEDGMPYSEREPYGSDWENVIGFSMRADDQYLIEDYVVAEARWQQMYRLLGVQTAYAEPEVASPSGEITMPYPGREAWTGQTLLTSDPKHFTAETGVDPQDDDPAPGEVVQSSPNEGYLVSVRLT